MRSDIKPDKTPDNMRDEQKIRTFGQQDWRTGKFERPGVIGRTMRTDRTIRPISPDFVNEDSRTNGQDTQKNGFAINVSCLCYVSPGASPTTTERGKMLAFKIPPC
ncbi:MAG: hypothetical protein HQM08_19745 [Candidatus Riflebacteria bacterium]|nr:hypothetical protein [Candidatus Riflebacteria bacterium]